MPYVYGSADSLVPFSDVLAQVEWLTVDEFGFKDNAAEIHVRSL